MKLTSLFLIILFLTSFIMSFSQNGYRISEGEKLVNSTLEKSMKVITEKYEVKPRGVGAAMPGGPIQILTLCFNTKYPLTKEQLRELLVNLANELVHQVNENTKIQKYLKEIPFTIRNTKIIIQNTDKNGFEVFDPEISVARITEGKLIYRTTDKNDTFKYKNEFEETYEEALKKIEK